MRKAAEVASQCVFFSVECESNAAVGTTSCLATVAANLGRVVASAVEKEEDLFSAIKSLLNSIDEL